MEYLPPIEKYLLDHPTGRGAVIVLPGGGYARLADHEGEPVARWLNRIGLSAFVLKYRVAPHRHPEPLEDVQAAIRYVRYHAQEWGIAPDKIGVLGFSAGGHLAASAGMHFDYGSEADDTAHGVSCRPDCMILCYPVITFGEKAHQGSIDNLLGSDPDEQLRFRMSLETQVTEHTPPAFIWHTADDASVPVENSLLLAEALTHYHIPYSLSIFPHGRHGVGLAEDDPVLRQWTMLCEQWLRSLGYMEGT